MCFCEQENVHLYRNTSKWSKFMTPKERLQEKLQSILEQTRQGMRAFYNLPEGPLPDSMEKEALRISKKTLDPARVQNNH